MSELSNKKTKVVHFSAGNLFGGIEVMLMTMAKFHSECPSLDQSFAFFFEGKVARQIRSLGVQVEIFPETKIRNILQVIRVQKAVKNYLKENRPDAVIVHGTWVHVLIAKVAKQLSINLVYWAHDPPSARCVLDWYVRLYRPNSIICNSLYTKSKCGLFLGDLKADVVYCPVEDINAKGRFSELVAFRSKWKTGQDDLVFLHVARWERHKGHEFLLQAAKLLKLNKNWKVWFVGKPQRDSEERYRREILNSVERQSLAENILFLGWQDDLSLVLAASDVYCQPNINPEPFGISIIEAMYAKLPVIVTPLGGPKETVTKSCGIHVEPNNVDDLASAMNRLFDKDYRSYLGENGRKRAMELSLPSAQLNKFWSLIL